METNTAGKGVYKKNKTKLTFDPIRIKIQCDILGLLCKSHILRFLFRETNYSDPAGGKCLNDSTALSESRCFSEDSKGTEARAASVSASGAEGWGKLPSGKEKYNKQEEPCPGIRFRQDRGPAGAS